MTSSIRMLAAAALIAGTIGCANRNLGILPPGPMQYQQYNASLHDPYSDVDAGPEVVGGRPRDFQKPLAEPVRSRQFRDAMTGF